MEQLAFLMQLFNSKRKMFIDHVRRPLVHPNQSFLECGHVQKFKFGQKFYFDWCPGTKPVTALFAVSAIFNPKGGREQTETEQNT